LNSDPCQPVREVLTNAVKLVFICMYVYYDYYVNFDWGRRSDPPGGADAFLAKNTPSSPHSASYTVLFSGQRVAVLEGFGGREWQGVKRCGSVFCARGADTEPQHVGFGGLWRALVVWRAVVALCRGGAERVEWVERVAGECDVRRAVVELQLELACVCLVHRSGWRRAACGSLTVVAEPWAGKSCLGHVSVRAHTLPPAEASEATQ
jgi:hypothetical protein